MRWRTWWRAGCTQTPARGGEPCRDPGRPERGPPVARPGESASAPGSLRRRIELRTGHLMDQRGAGIRGVRAADDPAGRRPEFGSTPTHLHLRAAEPVWATA